ncbi:MAG: ABC transporter substrate-binding protein [Eubacteriales bacterium]|nr:ABC transporter substrate-binding protein [Eubacteriales bacterium]
MKKLKKVVNVIAAAAMVMSMGSAVHAEEDIELVFATFKGAWAETLEDLFDKYTEEHPNVHVTVYTGESGDFFGDIQALIATDAIPNIFNLRGDNFGQDYIEYLQDVSDSPAIANVKDGFADGFTWDGVTYGAYYNYEIHGHTWDMEALASVGIDSVPKNHTEMMTVLQTLKDNGMGGIAPFGTAQVLYNHLGNAPLVMPEEGPAARYEGLVNGSIDPVDDEYFNEFFDYLAECLPYLQENPIVTDQATEYAETYMTDNYAWDMIQGTSGMYYGYETDYTDTWEIGPLCINDEDPYYVLNCQGFVVAKTGNEEVDAAALDLYNWFFTSDEVADALTKNYSILVTSKSYELAEDTLDPYTYKAYKEIEEFDSKAITYYMNGSLCNEYGAILQRYISGEQTKEEALSAVGEAFRSTAG